MLRRNSSSGQNKAAITKLITFYSSLFPFNYHSSVFALNFNAAVIWKAYTYKPLINSTEAKMNNWDY